jgi:hypothetical protein
MTKARDNKRSNNRARFAMYRDDYYEIDEGPTLVGTTVLVEADGCWNEYGWTPWSEWRQHLSGSWSGNHVPGSHEVERLFDAKLASGRR